MSEEYTNKSIDGEIINLVTTITGFSKLSDIFNELDDGVKLPCGNVFRRWKMSGFRRVLLKANVKEKLKACKRSSDSNYYND